MNRKSGLVLYLISAVCLAVFAGGLLMCYPASMLLLNQNSGALYTVASAMIWIGFLAGIILQIVVRIGMHKAVKAEKKGNSAAKGEHLLFRTKLSVLLLAVFIVGLIGSVVSITISVYGSWHLFIFIFLAVLGISEYLVFNSKYFIYFMKRS